MKSVMDRMVILAVAIVVGMAAGLALSACQYQKQACAVVDLAKMGCDLVPVSYVDPVTGEEVIVMVPKSEIRAAAKKAYMAAQDGGTK